MNDDRLLLEMRGWLQEEQVAMPDADEAGRRVAAMLPTVRQKRRWPRMGLHFGRSPNAPRIADTSAYRPTGTKASNGHGSAATGRTRFMLSPVKAIIGGVLILSMGAALMVARPLDQEQASMPGASLDPTAAAVVTGALRGEREVSPGTATNDAGISRTEGRETTYRWNASDPRLIGTETVTANWERYLSTDISVPATGVGATFRVLENEDGRWVGPTSFSIEEGNRNERRDVVVMQGEGAYEGLTALLVTYLEGVDYAPFVGVIVPGEMPPLPELPALEQLDLSMSGAQPDSPAQAVVTGAVTVEREVSPGITISDAGVSRTEGRQTTHRWLASDPRLSGEDTVTANWRRYASPDSSVSETGVGMMTRVLENDDGRWVGSADFAFVPGTDPRRDIAIMRGEGAYDGLTAFLVMERGGEEHAAFTGVIVPGEMPAFPEPPAE